MLYRSVNNIFVYQKRKHLSMGMRGSTKFLTNNIQLYIKPILSGITAL